MPSLLESLTANECVDRETNSVMESTGSRRVGLLRLVKLKTQDPVQSACKQGRGLAAQCDKGVTVPANNQQRGRGGGQNDY